MKRAQTKDGLALIKVLTTWAKQFPDSFPDGWEEDITDIEDEAAAKWKRKYEGMVKERDDQIRRKREAVRILTERNRTP